METTFTEEYFIGVVVNNNGEYYQSFSYYSGPRWTTASKDAKIYTKLGDARRRVTLIYQWNAHKKICMPIPMIRQFNIASFVDIDQSERISMVLKKEEQRKLNSEKNAAIWRKEQAQRDYDKAKAELDRLAKQLQ